MRDKVKGMHVSKQQKEKASLGVGYFLRRFLANLAKPAILHFFIWRIYDFESAILALTL